MLKQKQFFTIKKLFCSLLVRFGEDKEELVTNEAYGWLER